MPASESDRMFSESVSAVYEELLVPMIFESYADDMAHRLADVREGSVLEVAAGTGVVTRALTRALPATVSITATDLSPAMIDQARHVGTVRPVRWEPANVMALPFGPDSFDVVVCQFGAMFFDPKPSAFAEVHRVLRPAGQFLFSVWDGLDTNDFADAVAQGLHRLFPDDASWFLERTPHGYHDRATISADVRAGGFDSPSFETIDHRSRAATAPDVARAYCHGTPLRGEIDTRHPGRLADATAAATTAITERFGARDLDAGIRAQFVIAIK